MSGESTDPGRGELSREGDARLVDVGTRLVEPVNPGGTVLRTVHRIPPGTEITLGGERRTTRYVAGSREPFTITLAASEPPWEQHHPAESVVSWMIPLADYRTFGQVDR